MTPKPWLRLYHEVLDDPKVQCLDGATFKAWINILCLASRNDGFLPPLESVAFALRMDVEDARTLLERLLIATLIDKHSGGPSGYRYAPHHWSKRQYKSDTSTDRVKRFRQRFRNADETAPETETETETETEISEPKGSSVRIWICPADVDPQVWKDLLSNRKRKRQNNTPTAWKRFNDDLDRVSRLSGITPAQLIEQCAARGWGGIYDPRGNAETHHQDASTSRYRTSPPQKSFIDIAYEELVDQQRDRARRQEKP